MTTLDTYHAHLRRIASDYDRADPAFAARMREHAETIERRVVPAIPAVPSDAQVVGGRHG